MSKIVLDSERTKLCSICRNVFDSWDEIKNELKGKPEGLTNFPYYKDSAAWTASASEGCLMCVRWMDTFRRGEIDKLEDYHLRGVQIEIELIIHETLLELRFVLGHSIERELALPGSAWIYLHSRSTSTCNDGYVQSEMKLTSRSPQSYQSPNT